MNPPKVYFLTKIYHPNIHWETGEVCLDILKGEWSTKWSLSEIGKAISSLMFDPNADSPLNCDAGTIESLGNMIRAGDMLAFETTARMVTRTCAIPKAEYMRMFEGYQKEAAQTKPKRS